MDIKARLMNNQTFLLARYDFPEFNEQVKNEIDLKALSVKIFNLINILGPKAIVLECENQDLQLYLIHSLKEILEKEFTFDKLGGGVQILTSLPFYSEEPISLTSKVKSLGQFENQIGVGVEIGGKTINGVCIDGNGNIIKQAERETKKEEGYQTVIKQTIGLIRELLSALNPEKILSVGVGVPGGISPLFVRRMIIMEDFNDINLCAEIENAIGYPTFVENDANVIALGEKEISRIEGDFIILTLGESVGGGIIINERIVRGENYFAGELGHIIIDESSDAPICGCGNKGCLEAKFSAIPEIAKEKILENKHSIIDEFTKERKIDLEIIIKAAQRGDSIALDITDGISKDVAKAVEIITNLTNISQVLIGSSIAKFGYNFYEKIRENLRTTYVFKENPIEVYESSLERFPEPKRKFIGAIGAAINGMLKSTEISEKVVLVIKEDDTEMGKAAARVIADQIKRKSNTVLGLATGSTPISTYNELVRLHKEESLDFSQVTTFNLDEYYPIKKDNDQSYHTFMRYWFFNHVNISPKNIHFPDGEIPETKIDEHCNKYENLISESGGIDIQLLGIGGSYYNKNGEIIGGHIGFNEAGSVIDSRTRKVVLADKTRTDNARFFQSVEEVPRYALTMGVSTILNAKRVILLASGEHKAQIIREAVEGKITPFIPASVLQTHPNTTFIVEKGAASNLSRMAYPWLFFDIDWISAIKDRKTDEDSIDEALIWLSMTTKKPLTQLDLQDFHNNFLSILLELYDYNVPRLINEVIDRINAKIVYREKLPKFKKILIISSRPGDDAVIADLIKVLDSNMNEIKIVNMVSGNINVKNSDVTEYCERYLINESIKQKIIDDSMDMIELLQLKTLIRKSESLDMHAYLGLSSENLIFLNLPFYETRTIEKIMKISDADINPLISILDKEKPEIIFIHGGITDPHGLKARIVEIFNLALKQSTLQNVELWHYKTTMEEFSVPTGDIIIPFTEKEMDLKIIAIQQLKSQQLVDFIIFPGFDPRQLWERIKERNFKIGNLLKTSGLVPEEYTYATVCQVSQYTVNSSK